MTSLPSQFLRKILFNALIVSTGFLTLGSSVYGAYKVVGSFKTDTNIAVPEVQDVSQQTNTAPTNDAPTKPSSSTKIAPVSQINTISPTPTLTPATNTGSTQTNTSGCIVTLFGKQYDVSPLRSSHPGGDIFVCGTDMSAVYQNQHGTDVSRMSKYLISSSSSQGGQTSTTPIPTPTLSSGQNSSSTETFEIDDDKDDDEDEKEDEIEIEREHEDRENKTDIDSQEE